MRLHEQALLQHRAEQDPALAEASSILLMEPEVSTRQIPRTTAVAMLTVPRAEHDYDIETVNGDVQGVAET